MVLNPGDKAPHFSLPASTGETISLSDAAGRKVVLYFYPKDDTPGCVKEACSFRDANAELRAEGVEVLGVSADSLKSHRRFVEKYRAELSSPVGRGEDGVHGLWRLGREDGMGQEDGGDEADDVPHRRGGGHPEGLAQGKSGGTRSRGAESGEGLSGPLLMATSW